MSTFDEYDRGYANGREDYREPLEAENLHLRTIIELLKARLRVEEKLSEKQIRDICLPSVTEGQAEVQV